MQNIAVPLDWEKAGGVAAVKRYVAQLQDVGTQVGTLQLACQDMTYPPPPHTHTHLHVPMYSPCRHTHNHLAARTLGRGSWGAVSCFLGELQHMPVSATCTKWLSCRAWALR